MLQDTRHALTVLIQTDMGVGVATSCHMPQRAKESEYEAQAIAIEQAHALLHTEWSIWRGCLQHDSDCFVTGNMVLSLYHRCFLIYSPFALEISKKRGRTDYNTAQTPITTKTLVLTEHWMLSAGMGCTRGAVSWHTQSWLLHNTNTTTISPREWTSTLTSPGLRLDMFDNREVAGKGKPFAGIAKQESPSSTNTTISANYTQKPIVLLLPPRRN